MNQALILAEMIMLKNFRSRVPGALLLLLLPFLLAIWVINAENPGLQTIFAKDIGAVFLNLSMLVLMLVFALENLVWADQSANFVLSRVRRPLYLFTGQLLGIGFSLMACISALALIFFAFYRFVYGAWLFEILFSSYFIFLEAMVLLAAMILLSRLMSKFMALAMLALLYIFANSAVAQVLDTLKTSEGAGFVGSLLLTLLPDFAMFSYSGLILEQQMLNSQEALISTFYAILMIGFYLLLADLVAQRREL